MDTSELLEQLRRRIADTERDRDRLNEAVIALGDEIASLSTDEEVVARVVARFEQPPRIPDDPLATAPVASAAARSASESSGPVRATSVPTTSVPSTSVPTI